MITFKMRYEIIPNGAGGLLTILPGLEVGDMVRCKINIYTFREGKAYTVFKIEKRHGHDVAYVTSGGVTGPVDADYFEPYIMC